MMLTEQCKNVAIGPGQHEQGADLETCAEIRAVLIKGNDAQQDKKTAYTSRQDAGDDVAS